MSHKEIMERAAREAGRILLSYYGTDIPDERKEDDSIVTQADKKAEEKIITILTKDYPYSVVAEESGETIEESNYSWVIDPLDGTHNFIAGIPIFAVSIGLVRGETPVAGAIYLPVDDAMFFAEQGEGATMNDRKIVWPKTRKRPYIISDPSWRNISLDEFYGLLSASRKALVADIRILGACTYGLAMASLGKADAYIANGQFAWDFAAGAIIAEESGCAVTGWDGAPWRIGEPSLLVSRPGLHQELLKILKQ